MTYNYVSPSKFWELFTKTYKDEITRLQVGECMGPFSLKSVAEILRVRVRKAPDIVSLTTLSALPSILRLQGLYVIRIGQRRYGGAGFIVCKASRNYEREAFRYRDILTKKPDLTIPFSNDMWLRLSRISGEALAASAALKTIGFLHDMSYMIPQYRGGSSRFRFMVCGAGPTYDYWGQVEVDAAIFGDPDLLYVVEAKKSVGLNDGLFKYKIAFSMQALANILGVKTRGVIAIKHGQGRNEDVRIAILEPPAQPANTIVINNLKVELIADVKPISL